MQIRDLFRQDISRPINGVVKADQLDDASVWQELDEFVVTQELNGHLSRFFSAYCETLDRSRPGAAESIGVWISGFFGSGKSHFIKVLSYLLANRSHTFQGQNRRAVDFFGPKIEDALLFADIQRTVAAETDVILFNIDNKANARAGRDAILAVFLKVLNEMQGFSGDHPHIAHMERYLNGKDKLAAFHEAFHSVSGEAWLDERDAYEFHRDEVVQALAQSLGQSPGSCEKWIDGAEDNFALTVENLAKWVLEYLDSRGEAHRLILFVDEVGQFIGADPHLMLNLQTITEELGTVCRGRAWVVVTSQEDIDAALGDIGGSKTNDFSKIQGRFKTRLSLSSRNVDEVIQRRLLAKRPEAEAPLQELWNAKADIIKHQLTFHQVGMTFKQVKSVDDFAVNYPFLPYQFQLLQKVFESIRKAGATGLHLAQGERSLLDAFQSAGKAIAMQPLGVSVPLYLFYPSIESFLDSGVKRTIDHARENESLEDFDTQVLEVLFLIRYVDQVKGNLTNLVTLCLDQIDTDKLALRRRIEGSLRRLESETLISRSGDTYFFLTNEERDINREIKGQTVAASETIRCLGKLIFEDIFQDRRKHRYAANGMDFAFARICDQHPFGSKVEGGLVVSLVTPFGDDYETFDSSKCVLESTREGGQILIRLGESEPLERELRTYLKTASYLSGHNDGSSPSSTQRVLRDLEEDNHARQQRLRLLLEELLEEAKYFVVGKPLDIKSSSPTMALSETFEYLIDNSFAKMGLLKNLSDKDDLRREIQTTLRRDDVAQLALEVDLPERNGQAIDELRTFIDECRRASRPIVLHDLIHSRFALRPYGWPHFEILLLLARLYKLGEIHFVSGGAPIPPEQLYDKLTTHASWRRILIIQRATARPEELQRARQLGKDVFDEMGPDGEDALYAFLRHKAERWRNQLERFKPMAETGQYPGREQIGEGLAVLRILLAADQSHTLLARFNERREELLDLAEHFHDLENFYEHQRPTWENLRSSLDAFALNQLELERDDGARPALERMRHILSSPSPYGLIHETEPLISAVRQVNEALLKEHRAQALANIESEATAVIWEVEKVEGAAPLRDTYLQPFDHLRLRVESQRSLAHIAQAQREVQRLRDEALTRLEAWDAEQRATRRASQGQPEEVREQPLKPRRVIQVADLAAEVTSGKYFESAEAVETFLRALRQHMETALANDERIEIR